MNSSILNNKNFDLNNNSAEQIIAVLDTLLPEAQAKALAENNIIWWLAHKGHTETILHLMTDFSSDQRFAVLNNFNSLEAILRTAGGELVLDIIERLSSEQQTILLSKNYIIPQYFCSNEHLAIKTLNMVAKLSKEQQTLIFSTPYVANSFSRKGLALDVFDLVECLSALQKARVRISKGYDEVVSYCFRRKASRQPPRLLPSEFFSVPIEHNSLLSSRKDLDLPA